jgi:hypothetical protein
MMNRYDWFDEIEIVCQEFVGNSLSLWERAGVRAW